MSKWHVIRVEPGRDSQVAADLVRQDYGVLLAIGYDKLRVEKKFILAPKLRLPGFIFVEIFYEGRQRRDANGKSVVVEQDLRTVIDTNHVSGYLPFADRGENKPYEVSQQIIDTFRRDAILEYEELTRRVRRKDPLFSSGQVVRIIRHDLWQGYTCTVDEARPGAAVNVKLPNGWPARIEEKDLALVENAAAA